MKWFWTLFLLLFAPSSASALEAPKPVHSCVSGAYAIRILHSETAVDRLEVRGADLSLLVARARALVPNRDKLHFPIGKPRYECASISPDGSESLETIRVYDSFVHVIRFVPGASFAPIQYEIHEGRSL